MEASNGAMGHARRAWRIPAAIGIMTLVAVLAVGVGVRAASLSGAIFTTTPDGAIVNENVRYESKIEVYLDGGPGPNAPQTAAGLPDGTYYFQVTDPSGKVLLSEDPAKCREVEVTDGVITALVPGGTYTVKSTTYECAIQDEPDGVAGPSGRHDTNTDTDHGPPAIVVQLMPFFDTPNPGGVYKAWMIPTDRYLANGGDPTAVPKEQKVKGVQVGYQRDPGFGPPRDQVKTDNFKVKEYRPPEISVRKFEDVNGNGVRDAGEPEIGVDECVDATGAIVTCPGGWPYDFTEPVDGGTVTNTFYTPGTHVAGTPGTYTACETRFDGWTQTAAYLDGASKSAAQCVSVTVAGTSSETHEIWFGNFRNVSVQACKLEDVDGDIDTTDDQTPIPGWTVKLTKNGVVQDTRLTGTDGCYTWTNLGPVPGGYYDVAEVVPSGWTPLTPTSHVFASPPTSGASYSFTFKNWEEPDIRACKYEDKTGDGLTADDTPIAGWTVKLTKDGVVQDTRLTGTDGCYTWTDLDLIPAGHEYDVEEDVPTGWTPTSATSHSFPAPLSSGETYTFTFTNFHDVSVTACKLRDADGDIATTADQTPIPSWTVKLTKNGVVQDTQLTGSNGCYTWTNLPPVLGGYYDVAEVVPAGWMPLTPTYHAFESPPTSGASYSFTFVNTPTQGCTPGFWQGGNDFATAGGQWLWDEVHDPQWVASGGAGWNPYVWTTPFNSFFTPYIGLDGYDMMSLVGTGGGSLDYQKAARDLIAAYLNASWSMAYPYTTTELASMWTAAVTSGDFMSLHLTLDAANNGPGGCPISASGY